MPKSTRGKGSDSAENPKASGAPKTGKLALFTAAADKVLKSTTWRAITDTDQLGESHAHLPTGSMIVDYTIGGVPNAKGIPPCPGLPRKCITQLWGYEGAGKTTLALTAAAATIRAGGVVVYLDWENAIVLDYAVKLGVPVSDSEKFVLAQPDTLEEGLKLILIAANAGADLIVIDSVGAAVPANIAEREMTETGEQARVGLAALRWSEFMPQLRKVIRRQNCAVLGISQVRAKIGGMGNGPKSEPQGGWSWKFYTDLRMELTKIGAEKSKSVNTLTNKTEERVSGAVVKLKIVKCKLSDAMGREEIFYLRNGEGIDDTRSVIDIAVNHSVIRKSGGWYYYGEAHKWNGLEQVRTFFKSSEKEQDLLIQKIKPHLAKKTDTGPETDIDDSDMPSDLLDEFIQISDEMDPI